MSRTPPPDPEHTSTPLQVVVDSIRSAISKAALIEKLPGVEPFLVIKTPDTFKSTGKNGKKELLEPGQLTTEQTLVQYQAKQAASWSPGIKNSKASCFQGADITLCALINLVVAETGIWDVFNGEKAKYETCVAIIQMILEQERFVTASGKRLGPVSLDTIKNFVRSAKGVDASRPMRGDGDSGTSASSTSAAGAGASGDASASKAKGGMLDHVTKAISRNQTALEDRIDKINPNDEEVKAKLAQKALKAQVEAVSGALMDEDGLVSGGSAASPNKSSVRERQVEAELASARAEAEHAQAARLSIELETLKYKENAARSARKRERSVPTPRAAIKAFESTRKRLNKVHSDYSADYSWDNLDTDVAAARELMRTHLTNFAQRAASPGASASAVADDSSDSE
jgi:hypothetical protein